MGIKFVIDGFVTSDTEAPKIPEIDPIESSGSLFLVEPANPTNPWTAGTPADNASVPNLLPIAAPALTGFTVQVNGGINNNTKGKVERTDKGGLHVIISQANALASGDGASVEPTSALNTYIAANLEHDYYFSAWDRVTRQTLATDGELNYVTYHSSSAGLFLANTTFLVPSGVTILGTRSMPKAIGPRMGNVAVNKGITGISNAAFPEWGIPAGGYVNATLIGTHNNKWASFIFYRCYMEDLTVSGRDYSEVDAIDHALYTKQVLTPGGRYYGDTFTDPTTIP